jgi:hypothetical protein
MGRPSKATKARRNNLQRLKNHQKSTVEGVSNDEASYFEDEDLLEHVLDDAFSSEDDSYSDDPDSDDEELEDDELDGLMNEAKIEHFNAILFEAQAIAVKAECEASGKRTKRKRHYTGNSNRTRQYHAQKRRQLAATGQKFINSWFSKKRKLDSTTGLQPNHRPAIIEVSEDSEPSDDEEVEDEDDVNASLHRLFPGTVPVSISKLKTKK